MAYRTGRADLSILQEAHRIRGQATGEITILAAEIIATAAGVGAVTKAIRAGKLLDGDGLSPAALAKIGGDISKGLTAEVRRFITDESGAVRLSISTLNDTNAH